MRPRRAPNCGSDVCDSYPRYHADYGADWATDLYAPAGTKAYFHISGATGKTSFSYSTSPSSCGAGIAVRINISVGGKNLGWVQYDHLNTANTNFTNGIANGEFLGTTKQWPYSTCYQVTAPSGVHSHFSASQVNRFSCWLDYGKVGTAVTAGLPIAILGANNTAAQTKCATGASVSAYNVTMVQWSGDTKAQKTSWLVRSDGKRYSVPTVAIFNCLKSDGVPGAIPLQQKVLDLIVLSAVSHATCLIGDLNYDLRVGCRDLAILKANYGKSGALGDLNRDGTVTILDLSILLSNFTGDDVQTC